MLQRFILPSVRAALKDTRVVLINGPRQAGKSTLAAQVIDAGYKARYLTLDEASVLSGARSNPTTFLESQSTPLVIDEVQRAPELLLAIKVVVDRDQRPGRYLLTGSANVMMLPSVSDSLAGRIEIATLWPLSQGEIEGSKSSFIDTAFSARFPSAFESRMTWNDLVMRIVRGGFPEAVERTDQQRRAAWFGAYITTILQRDIRDLANIEGLTDVPRLLALIAARSSSLLNYTELSRSIALPVTTLKRYMALLELTFMINTLPAWSGNLSKRLVKSPKLMVSDSGLAAHLVGADHSRLLNDPTMTGPLLESFVVMELRKQLGWSRARVSLHHFRSQAGQEVDIVLEDASGRLVGIEVKAAKAVSNDSFNGLRHFAESVGDKFIRGIVLYAGSTTIAFDKHMLAVPIDALWRAG